MNYLVLAVDLSGIVFFDPGTYQEELSTDLQQKYFGSPKKLSIELSAKRIAYVPAPEGAYRISIVQELATDGLTFFTATMPLLCPTGVLVVSTEHELQEFAMRRNAFQYKIGRPGPITLQMRGYMQRRHRRRAGTFRLESVPDSEDGPVVIAELCLDVCISRRSARRSGAPAKFRGFEVDDREWIRLARRLRDNDYDGTKKSR